MLTVLASPRHYEHRRWEGSIIGGPFLICAGLAAFLATHVFIRRGYLDFTG
jgi:hypothetical protein